VAGSYAYGDEPSLGSGATELVIECLIFKRRLANNSKHNVTHICNAASRCVVEVH
jgi:hypothetical protein